MSIKAPFTEEQVKCLNDFQKAGYVHPFTCGTDKCGADLVATKDGWICNFCNYKQDWAHEEMTRFVPMERYTPQTANIPTEKIGVDTCLDVIYELFDNLFRNGHFEAANKILEESNPNWYPTDIIITFLTVTKVAASKLPARSTYFNKAKETLKARKETDPRLLENLE